jgi:hypothetical protein
MGGPDDPTWVPPDETHVEQEIVETNEARCHRCGAPHDRFQEYCLECGARLTPLPGQYGRRDTWTTTGSPLWFWASLLALLVIALITAAVVIAATKDDKKAAATTTFPTTVVPTGLTTVPIGTTTLGTVPTLPPTTTFTTPAPTTAATTTAGTTTNANGLTVWPSGKSGYTIILESVPESSGKNAADTKARAAQQKGLPQVGVLRTSNYKDLTPGYYAVFSGVKDTQAEAEAGLTQAKSAGYSTAYVRQIVPK